MLNLSFSKALVDQVVRYLMSRPYAEVADLLEKMNKEAAPQLNPQPKNEAANAPEEVKPA